MRGRAPRRPLSRKRFALVWCLSLGVGLVPGGLAFGFIGQLFGQPQQWSMGVGVAVLGAVVAAIGGIGLLVTQNDRGPVAEGDGSP